MDIQMVFDCLDLNQASGKTLELYGDTMGQRRGLLNDEQYRYMIFIPHRPECSAGRLQLYYACIGIDVWQQNGGHYHGRFGNRGG